MKAFWLFFHQSDQQMFILPTYMVLLRISTIDINHCKQMVSFLLQNSIYDNSDNNNNRDSAQQQLTPIQRLIFHLNTTIRYQVSYAQNTIRTLEGKELTEEEYIQLARECNAESWLGFLILRFLNLVNEECIDLLLEFFLQPKVEESEKDDEAFRYLLSISSQQWKQVEEKREKLLKRLEELKEIGLISGTKIDEAILKLLAK